jgi:hypothetical protein
MLVMAAGDNYTFRMPTEELKGKLEETQNELRRVRKLLDQALETRCPDPECRNCGRWNAWYSDWGRNWYRCPDCGAGPGKPCWDKRAAQGQLVRLRPHQRRKMVTDPLGPAL